MASGTESISPRYEAIAQWPSRDAIAAMLEGQLAAVAAVGPACSAIADAADAAAARLHGGSGRIVYAGAGASGRIAAQDGVELGPTFNWPAERLVLLIAGGMAALASSVEGAEDDADAGHAAVADAAIGADDVMIGIAASGRTRFTCAATTAARDRGALTIAIANAPATPLLAIASHPILADTGAEAVAGSTRMKAGTAQKVIVNLLSTAIMLRLGRVYRGLMVEMVASNDKLRARANQIVAHLAGVSEAQAIAAIAVAHGDIKTAVLIALGHGIDEATVQLRVNERHLDQAIAALGPARAA